MATGSLPPQAYTRETLTSAFNWLQSQPESVRKAATSPDTLVALYTRGQRFGSSTLQSDAPVSSQAFMSDLKNLAEGLKEFEEPRPVGFSAEREEYSPKLEAAPRMRPAAQHGVPQDIPQAMPPPAYKPDHRPDYRDSDLRTEQIRPEQMAPRPPPRRSAPSAGFAPPSSPSQAASPRSPQPPTGPQGPANYQISYAAPSPNFAQALNDRSLAMVQEVRTQLNLSSEAEAVNLMVALAYKSLRSLLV